MMEYIFKQQRQVGHRCASLIISVVFVALNISGCKGIRPEDSTSVAESEQTSSLKNIKISSSPMMQRGFLAALYSVENPKQLDDLLKALDDNFQHFGVAKGGEGAYQPFLAIPTVGSSSSSWKGIVGGQSPADLQQEYDIKLLAATAPLLRLFSGIFWRVDGLLDGLGARRSVRRSLISSLVAQISGVRLASLIGENTNLSNIVVDYLTQPWWDQQLVGREMERFKSIDKFQEFVKEAQVDSQISGYPMNLPTSVERVKEVIALLKKSSVSHIDFDASLLANAPGMDIRYRGVRVGLPDLQGVLAGLLVARHNAKVFVGFNLNDLVDFMSNQFTDLAVGGSLLRQIKSRREIGYRHVDFARNAAKTKYISLFTVSDPSQFSSAFKDISAAVALIDKAINGVTKWSDNGTSDPFFLSPFQPIRFDKHSKRVAKLAVINLLNMTELRNDGVQPAQLTNPITSEIITINLQQLYRVKKGFDFKRFIPGVRSNSDGVRFEEGDFRTVDSDGPYKYSLRDYRAGTPVARDYTVYAETIFPKMIKDESSYRSHIQSLTTSYGTFGIASPLLGFF